MTFACFEFIEFFRKSFYSLFWYTKRKWNVFVQGFFSFCKVNFQKFSAVWHSVNSRSLWFIGAEIFLLVTLLSKIPHVDTWVELTEILNSFLNWLYCGKSCWGGLRAELHLIFDLWRFSNIQSLNFKSYAIH